MRKLSCFVFALAVFVSTFSLTAQAQSSDVAAQTVPPTSAQPLITSDVDEANLTVVRILPPSASMGFDDRGPVDPSLLIEGQLLLKRSPAQEKALELWKTQVGTPSDPNYGQTLTPREYSETFGVDKSDVSTLVSWLMSHNIEVTSSSSGQLAINFRGTVVDLESAFHTEIHSYLAPDGNVYYAPSTDLKFPKAFSDIIDHPVGLNSMATKSLPGFDAPVTANGEKFAPTEDKDTTAEAEPHASLPDLLETNLTSVVAHGFRPDLSTPTMTVSVSPTSIQGSTVVSPTITATLTFSGGTAPTGTFTFMDGNYLINLTVNATTCTTGATTVVCTQAFSSAPIGGYTPDYIYAAYSGDSNFNSAYNAAAAQLAYTGPTGTKPISAFSLTVTSGAQTPGTGSSQSIVVTLTGTSSGGVPTGTVIVAGSAQWGLLFSSTLGSDSRCVLATRTYTCTYPWSPGANAPAGEYQIFGGYSGSSTYEGPYGTAVAFNFKVINTTGTTTTTVAQSNPPGTTNTSLPSSTITTVTTWTGASAQATGNLQLTGTFANEGDTAVTQIYATVSYPTVGNTTSSGFGGFVTANFSPAVDAVGQPFTYSYTCTENATALTVTCNTTIPNLGAALTTSGSNTITATYYGDATYKDSSGTTTVISSSGATASTTTLTAGTAAYASPVTYTTTISTASANPTGSYVLSGTPIGTYPLSTTINTTGTTPCVVTTDVKTCTNSVTLPAAAAVGSMYTVTSAYSGTATIAPSSGTVSVTITQQTPTFGTMTVTPSAVTVGTNQAVVLSDTFSWVGSGTAPTGAVTYTLNSVNYPATCTPATSPQTCTYTVPGATIAALAAGSYSVSIAYVGDTNYASATGAPGTLTITSGTNSLAASPTSETYGANGSTTLTDTLTFIGTSPIATGSVALTNSGSVPPTVPAIATINLSSCASSIVSGNQQFICTYVWTPPAGVSGDTAGTQTVSATYTGNYSVPVSTTTYTINKATTTMTLTASPNFVNSGSVNTTLTAVISWAGVGLTPTGTISFVCVAGTNGCGTNPATLTINATNCPGYTTTSPSPITCSETYDAYDGSTSFGTISVTGTYSGDINYGTSSATSNPINVTHGVASTTVISVTSGSPETYGTAGTVVFSVVVTGKSGDGAPSGTLVLSNPTLGTMATVTMSTCTVTNTYTYTCAVNYVVPAATAPNTYTVTATYNSSNVYYNNSSGTTTFVVQKQTPTFGTMSFSPASSEPYGTNQAITINDTLIYTGTGAAPSGAVTFTLNSVQYTAACTGSSSPLSCTATVPGATIAALPVAAYTVTVAYTTDTNYNAATGANGTFTITQAATTVSLVAATPGSPSSGVTSTTLTATMGPAVNGATVTFTDTTTGNTVGTATTTAGVATITVNTTGTGSGQTSTPSAGLNNFTATVTGTANYTAATSSPVTPVYYQGLLFSVTVKHNFSTDPGTVDGSPVCNGSNGTPGSTCTSPFGVTVYNFTPVAQTVQLSFTNSAANAFSSATNCGTLAAGATCQYVFYYLPPYGDGNSTTVGLYEQATWIVSGNAGTLTGVGDPAFDRSGASNFPAILAGKALLPSSNPVSATPLSLTFGPQAPGALSGTQNVTVTNNGTASIGMTYTPPAPSQFIVTNSCPSQLAKGASCNIGIAFQSSTAGTVSGTETITPAGGTPIMVNVSGTVNSTSGSITLSTVAHNFGNVTDNSSVTSGFTVTNTSGQAVTLTFNDSGSSEYTINYGSCASSLANNSSCSVSVTFTPTAAGSATNTLTVGTTAANIPILPGGGDSANVVFTGTGVAGGNLTVSTSTHNFGSVAVDSTSGVYGVTMTNSTGAAVTLSYGSTGSQFALVANMTNCTGTLANNASCQMAFTYSPTTTGFVSDTYTITANGGAVPVFSVAANGDVSGITLEGTGTAN